MIATFIVILLGLLLPALLGAVLDKSGPRPASSGGAAASERLAS